MFFLMFNQRLFPYTNVFICVWSWSQWKTVVTTICTALASREKTVSTSLMQINRENFETLNNKNKRLVVINDAESYHGPTYIEIKTINSWRHDVRS